MTKANYTHLTLVVDRSGSMSSIREDSQGGINSLIKEQAEVPGEITVTLYEFDTYYNKVFGPVPASEAPQYSLVPRGMTALLDATGRAVAETGEWLANKPENERPDRVMFVVVTDGGENASQEYTRDKVKEMITHQENKYNWEFVYLGANVDTFAEASSIGIGNHIKYHSTGVSAYNAYAGVSSSLRNARINDVTLDSVIASEYTADGEEVSNNT